MSSDQRFLALAVVATTAENARFYFRFRPPRLPVAADPHFLTHRGQFLVDREGIVRSTNVECAREGLAGLGQFPTDAELLAAVRRLPA